MRAALRELLVCPVDGAPLSDSGTGLTCSNGHEYPVTGGVPRMTPGAQPGEDDQTATADSFGAKWTAMREEHRETVFEYLHDWYNERYGFADDDALAGFLADKHTILDAGAGLGRDVSRYARLSNAEVVGLELSPDTIDRAVGWYGEQERTNFVNGDILAPPFAPESFDFVVADQVIHHTPDCPRAFRTLAELVRPGGVIAIYVYRKKGMIREWVDDDVRAITSAMTPEQCWELSEQITELGRELSQLNAKITLEKGVPLLGIEPGEHDVQRLIYWNILKCYWNEDLGHDLSVLVNFDWYHPPYASRHTAEEVEGWCAEAGLDVVHMDVIESGISFRAVKPR